MKKRIFSLALALVMIMSVCFSLSASAADVSLAPLKFSNGEFKIMHLTDCQDTYPADQRMLKFIDASIKEYKPDIIVLGGDNIICKKEDKEAAVDELVSIFVENKTYFTLVFGNHDCEQGWTNDELLPLYQKYGEGYCLAYDAVPALHGTATHNLPVMDSTGTKVKFNLWMFDSGSHVYDDAGNDLGYDCVTEDQIKWYQETSKTLETVNGGKVPSLAFQHIVVGDVFDALFRETSVKMGELTPSYNGKTYSFFPKTENIQAGFLFEFPCPGYYNYGQFDAMVKRGDVLGVFSGHDHINSYETELEGVKIINTPGSTFHSYGNDIVRGMRMITVKEDNTWSFDSEVVTVSAYAKDNSDFASDAGIDATTSALWIVLGDVLLALNKLTTAFSSVITAIFG